MNKITVDKALIEQAISALADTQTDGESPQWDIEKAAYDALRTALAEPPTQTGVGNSGFDHKIAADFMSGREINDENVRKFVMASRWAHDDRASLQALVATLRQDVAARDAEIALLKQSLLDAEALAEPAVEPAKLGAEWAPCMKLPVVVHVRNQRDGEQHVSTREGITPVKPDDLIMRGVSGEEYPISRAIFDKTYTFDISPQPAEVPLLTDEEMMEMVTANAGYGGTNFDRVARAIEQAVRQKAGL